MTKFVAIVAVVTGGASGIGRSLCAELARRGARVVVSDVERDRALAVAEDLTALGGTAVGFECDVTDYSSVEALRGFTLDTFEAVNLVCNNAGVAVGGTLDATKPNDFSWMFAVNVFGIYHGIEVFVPALRAAKQRGEMAYILNTASEHALGIPPWVPPSTAYSATKHAVLGLS